MCGLETQSDCQHAHKAIVCLEIVSFLHVVSLRSNPSALLLLTTCIRYSSRLTVCKARLDLVRCAAVTLLSQYFACLLQDCSDVNYTSKMAQSLWCCSFHILNTFILVKIEYCTRT